MDSSDYSRLEEAKDVLHNLVLHDKISGKPLIILANKQDNEDALDEIDIIEKLQLEDLVNNQQCPTLVESCAATETTSKSKLDPGIEKAYHWLINYIIRNYYHLNDRVLKDVKEQEERENEIRLETMKRIKLRQEQETTTEDDVIELYSDYNKKVNGVAQQIVTNTPRNYSEISSSASESPEEIHYANIEETTSDRPKSARQMVKEQLQLEQIKQRSPLKLRNSKKTAPVNLYGGVKTSHSANINNRKEILNESRNLKSAGDSIFIVSNLPNSISSPTDRGDLFHLNNFEQKRKLPPLIQKDLNGRNNDENAISIVEID